MGNWSVGIKHEVDFWSGWVKGKGLIWESDWAQRLNPESLVEENDIFLADVLDSLETQFPKVLDVGAGPISTVGKYTKSGKKINLKACDPLGPAYEEMLNSAGVKPLTMVEFGIAESLSNFYIEEKFDVVYSINALDHGIDPIRALENMLYLTSDEGFVVIGHYRNEAIFEKGSGFHKWNFDTEKGDLIIHNHGNMINVNEYFGNLITIETVVEKKANGRDWIQSKMKKSRNFVFENDSKAIIQLAREVMQDLTQNLMQTQESPVEQQQAKSLGSRILIQLKASKFKSKRKKISHQ
jgi:hypothetical protein